MENSSSTTANHVDSDSTSTSSQTSSEHEPQIVGSSTLQNAPYHHSQTNQWSDDRPSFIASSSSQRTPLSPSLNLTSTLPPTMPSFPHPPTITTSNNHLLTESTHNHHPHTTHNSSTTVMKSSDQLPEYKLFGSNTPSIHTILFGMNDNSQGHSTSSSSSSSHRPFINSHEHDVREIEKKLMGICRRFSSCKNDFVV